MLMPVKAALQCLLHVAFSVAISVYMVNLSNHAILKTSSG